MTEYYVDSVNGNVANGGTSWADALDTLNNAEDIPVSAGDTVHCRGVFRETLTCDVSGSGGNPISYIGHLSPDTGTIARITGSDDDAATTRNYGVNNDPGRDYRTFRGFLVDGCATRGISTAGDVTVIEDCTFQHIVDRGVYAGTGSNGHTIRRCRFIGNSQAIFFYSSSAEDDTGIVIENCQFLGSVNNGVYNTAKGGVTVSNCYFLGGSRGVNLGAALNGGQTFDVINSLFNGCFVACNAAVATYLVEDYNNFYVNDTDRTNVAVGGNSNSVLTLLEAQKLIDGYLYEWEMGQLSQWSSLGSLAGTSVPADDLHGFTRAGTSSWGPFQYETNRRPFDSGTSRGRRGT